MRSRLSRRVLLLLLLLLVAALAATATRLAAPTQAHPTKPHVVLDRAPNAIELQPILDFACFS